ncbi:MAG: acyl--CoA ligase [Chloroflexi bacterium]|nr:acyl--CoA ligase [Chloroflexota bacterium]
MTSHPSPETLEKIHQARTVNGRPPEDRLIDLPHFGDLLDRRAAEYAHKTFLIHYDEAGNREEVSYSELNRAVNKSANYLSKELGVGRGDRVATIGYNHSDLVIISFACWKLGAVVAPQNIAEDDQRINFILRNSQSVVLLVRFDYLARAAQIVAGEDEHLEPVDNVRQIVQVGGDPSAAYPHFQTEIEKQRDAWEAPEQVRLDDEALLVYTSGTTGAPKGVVLMQYNMLVDALGIAEWHGITADQRMMCVLPIHHVNGIIVTLVTPLLVGGSTVLNFRYSSSHFWERIAKEQVQIVSVVPTLLQFSLEYADKAAAEGRSIWGEGVSAEDLGAFRHFICGAGTLAVGLATTFEERFKMKIVHGYGLSESTCYSCFLPPDLDWETHREWMSAHNYPSIGVPIHPNEMAIFDATGSGTQLGPGERGEICIRGHNIMKYYFLRPDVNDETFKFGWFRSGDEGFYLTDDQDRPFFFITGRIKELINRGGVKFSPFDIEEVLLEIPGIHTGLAIGFENDSYGEEVGAYVVLEEGVEVKPEEILAYCRERMTFEKSPKVVVFGTDIPVTSTGKYQRLKLRDRFAEHKSVQFRPEG